MDKVLRITNLVTWILSSVVILLGGFIPLMLGLAMGVGDAVLFLFRGVDGNDLYPDYTGGSWLLFVAAVTVVSAVLVFSFSIAVFFLSKKPWFALSTSMIAVNCVILSVNTWLQLLAAFWMNHQSNPFFQLKSNIFYLAPAIEFVFLIGMAVITVFSIRNMKQNDYAVLER